MGEQSRLKRTRHELRQREEAALAADTRLDDPALQQRQVELFDAGCRAIRDRDGFTQRERLTVRGYRQVYANNDGVGLWQLRRRLRLLHSMAREDDGQVWAHVSVSNPANTMPTWHEVRDAGWLLYPGHHGIIVVAPQSTHVNIANVAHVWYCLTGLSCPDFTHGYSSI